MDGPATMEMNGAVANTMPEMPQVRVPDLERIRNARKRRMMQIKEWQQYDRKMTRESEKLQRKGLSPPGDKSYYRTGPQVKFPQSLIFLEAAARGDLDEVRKLLSNGVCPDVANEDELTALHQQMYRFSAEEAAELKRQAELDPNICCIDNTPEMCRLLLRFGANPNARDTERWTPLHAAATCHHTELCAILIAHGADLLAMNADGNMPYECCLPGPTLSLIETEMDKRGITQEELDDLHRLPECEMLADMETLYKTGADLNALDKQGASLLHIAAACGFEEVTIFLLKHGAKIDLLDRDGWQAIHIAACWEHLEIIEILVNFGANIFAETTSGETVFDICDDLEMHARLIEIKEEVERKQFQQQDSLSRPEKPRELVRRRSSTNPRSASIRRTSMREKKMISWKEAKQEAEMRGVAGIELTEGDTLPTNSELVTAANAGSTRRVTSPLTVSTNTQSQSSSKGAALPTSPSVPSTGRPSSIPQSPPISSSHVNPSDTIPSPKSKRPMPTETNGVKQSVNEPPFSLSNSTRASSKGSERSKHDPPQLRDGKKPNQLDGERSSEKAYHTIEIKPEYISKFYQHSSQEPNPQGLFNRGESKRRSSRRKKSGIADYETVRGNKMDEAKSARLIQRPIAQDNRRHSNVAAGKKVERSSSTVVEQNSKNSSVLRRTRSLPSKTNRHKLSTHSRVVSGAEDSSQTARDQSAVHARRAQATEEIQNDEHALTDSAIIDPAFVSQNVITHRPSILSSRISQTTSVSANPTRTLNNQSTRRVRYIEPPQSDQKQSKWCCCS